MEMVKDLFHKCDTFHPPSPYPTRTLTPFLLLPVPHVRFFSSALPFIVLSLYPSVLSIPPVSLPLFLSILRFLDNFFLPKPPQFVSLESEAHLNHTIGTRVADPTKRATSQASRSTKTPQAAFSFLGSSSKLSAHQQRLWTCWTCLSPTGITRLVHDVSRPLVPCCIVVVLKNH